MNKNRHELAVALQYDGKTAPRVTASGQDVWAERICQLAKEHDIPMYYEPVIASILSEIPPGDEIPEFLYRAIAEIIAFAYMLSGKTPDDLPE